ncbi:MAG: hypothetical protein M3Q10_12370, partial [Chloroflexota bacterium]|nr:hypothetical protein [Chloroflexota bacterium]
RAAARAWPTVRRIVLVLLAFYVVKQLAFVFGFRPFTGHDEVAHYGYLRTVATEGRVPVLPDMEEWRAELATGRVPQIDGLPADLYRYCAYALYWHCEPDDPQWASSPPRMVSLGARPGQNCRTNPEHCHPTGEQYAANHPPLYYLLMTPIYWATSAFSPEAQLYWLRLAAIPFGLATVFLAYRTARALFPGDAFLAVTVPAFVAFQTQISYEAAMVNNDIVAIALYSWILFLLVVGVRERFPRRLCVLLGFVLGLGLLTKGNALTAAPIIALAIVLAVGWRNVRTWVERGALVVLPAVVLAAPWYVFLYRTYGNFDGLEQIQAIQSWWNEPAGTFFGMMFSRDFVAWRFRETWGEFGWRRLPLDPALLWAIAIPLLVAAAGLVWYLVQAVRRGGNGDDPVLRPRQWQWQGLLVLGVACAVAYLAVLQFGTRFALTQARYFFPVVNAAALLLMLGLRTLIPRAWSARGQVAVVAALVLLNVVIFAQYVIPYYQNS